MRNVPSFGRHRCAPVQLFERLEPRRLLAAAHVAGVQDLANRSLSAASAALDPKDLTILGSRVFFTADDRVHGRELWVTDGSANGTRLVRDINNGLADSRVSNLTVLGNQVLFVADDGTHGLELWRSDGTAAGTTLVKDINPGSDSSLPGSMTAANGTVFFSALTNSLGSELWKTDGTSAGTVMVKDIAPGLGSSSPGEFVAVNGITYFAAENDLTTGRELWRTDGTDAGTTLVKDINPMSSQDSAPTQLTALDGSLIFVANIDEIWCSDGTAAGTSLLRDVNATPIGLRAFAERLYFNANGRLWSTDGTAAGTAIDDRLVPGFTGFIAADFDALGDLVFFTSVNPVTHSFDLWRSDHTAGGTFMIRSLVPNVDVAPEPVLSHVRRAVGQTLYFTGFDPASGFELYRTDGTLAGTRLVTDIFPARHVFDPAPRNLTAVNGHLIFAANAGSGYELWTTNGTALTTRRVADVFTESTKLDPLA